MRTVQTAELATTSVRDLSHELASVVQRIDLGSGTLPLTVTRVADVDYMPDALLPGQSLQFVGGRFVPLEAVFDDFTSTWMKQQLTDRGVKELAGFQPSREAGDVCILGNVFSRNFTHWHEELMKVIVLERAGIPCTYVLSGLPDFAREFLLLLGIPEERIVECGEPTTFQSALFTTAVSYRNLSQYPGVLHALREALFEIDLSDQPNFDSRLWLDRGEQTRLGRGLVNAEDVYGCLASHGFTFLDMGAQPLKAQIAAARSAEVLAGLHGSHFVHSQLMAPGSRVIECFSPMYLNPTYTEIYRVMRHRYSQVTTTNTPVFPYEHGNDVEVDLQQLELALQELE